MAPSLHPRIRNLLVGGALVLGVGAGSAAIAGAATTTSTTPSTTSTAPLSPPSGTGAPMNPATMAHGPGETLLTGSDLTKAEAAAQTAEPGATVIRAETDSSGQATYEVHMQKSDGSYVTVELDSSFSVTGTTSGFGPGPSGSAPAGMVAPTH